MTQTLRAAAASGRLSNKGPALPIKPIPKEPPKNFLSSAAVMHLAGSNQRNSRNLMEELEQLNSSSCGALLELNAGGKGEEWGRRRIIAGEQPKKHRRDGTEHRIHQQLPHHHNNGGDEQCKDQQYGTAGRAVRAAGGRRSARSSSANASGGKQTAFCSLRRITQHRHMEGGEGGAGGEKQKQTQKPQQESPQTDISYLQSSDGTNGSTSKTKKHQHQGGGRLPDQLPQQYDDTPEYDPVMTDSFVHLINDDTKRKRGKQLFT